MNNTFDALNTNMVIVDGEHGATQYPVNRGYQMVLFDQYTDTFYLKGVEMSGKTLPLRTFKYEEIIQEDPIEANNNKVMELLEEIKNQLIETNNRVSQLEQRQHNRHNKPKND